MTKTLRSKSITAELQKFIGSFTLEPEKDENFVELMQHYVLENCYNRLVLSHSDYVAGQPTHLTFPDPGTAKKVRPEFRNPERIKLAFKIGKDGAFLMYGTVTGCAEPITFRPHKEVVHNDYVGRRVRMVYTIGDDGSLVQECRCDRAPTHWVWRRYRQDDYIVAEVFIPEDSKKATRYFKLDNDG